MKKMMVMNHFPTIYPPNTGGVLRYFHIYNQLSKFYDITLLSQKYTPKVEVINYSSTLREFRIPTDEVQHAIDKKLISERTGPRFSTHAALCCALLDQPPPAFLEYYNQFYSNTDIIIHECPFMLNYDMNWGTDTKPRIYNSHNQESKFAQRVWYGKNVRKYINHVTLLEKKLVQKAKLVFATSREEKTSFAKTFKSNLNKIKLSPNGIIPGSWNKRMNKRSTNARITAFFIGSMHQPNIEIVKFIVTRLSKRCPNIDFIIAGQCGNRFSRLQIKNITFLGEIDEEQKRELFSTVDIAINPAFFGTGTKIKTIEFLSAGIPLISTRVGVKGIRLVKGTHYIPATNNNFASILNKTSQDKSKLEKIALSGQRFVNRNYSWEAIAARMKVHIDAL